MNLRFLPVIFLILSIKKVTSDQNSTNLERCDKAFNGSFTCSFNGRYAAPGDVTCTQYYYCFKLSSGTFTQTLYTCNLGLFDERVQACDRTYNCPCSTNPTNVTSTTEQSLSTTSLSTPTIVTNATTEKSTTQHYATTSTANCDTSNLNHSFTCTANGRYAVPGDATCKKYYYCFKLSSGNFSQSLYTCTEGLFNETVQACDKTYNCPCATNPTNVSTATSADTSTTKQSISTTSISSSTDATNPSTGKSSTQQTTTTTASSNCDTSNLNTSFTCAADGRYAVPGDATCKKYYYCFKLSSGKFSQSLYSCSVGLFNEIAQSCDKSYTCPCSENTTNVISTTEQYISTASSFTPSSVSSTNTEKSTTQQPTNTASVSTATTSNTATTEKFISTTILSTSTNTANKSTTRQPTTILPANCDASKLNNSFSCAANGRYAVPGDTTCAKYYYCFKLSSGKFTQTLYTCNVGLFNETAQACDKTYNCPCSTNTTSSVTSTTKQSISTTSSSIPTSASSTNTEKSTTQQPTNTTKVSTATTADSATTEHYISTTTYATDKSTTQQPTTILPVNCDVRFLNNTFTCVANGRYSVPGDTTCAKYYYCFKLSSGKFTQTLYTCNVGLFNETARACDKTYNCPCSTNTTSSVTSTTKQSISTTSSSIPTSASSTNTEKSTTQQPTNTTKVSTATTADSATTEHYISTTTYATDKSTTQQPTTILPVNCDVRFLNNTFTCVANGRYAVPGDTTCAKYYYCFKLSSGKFTQTLYTCNVGLFNETAQACDKTYNCPCSTNTTSSVTSTTKQSISTTSSSIPTSGSSTNTEKSTTQQPTNTTKVSTATTADTATTEHYISTTTYATDKSTTQQPTTILPVNCDVRFLNNTFTCVANGRYSVPGDTTCAKYYYCFKLSSGKFTQTLYTCNVGLFNETAQACDKTYNCSCSTNTTSSVTSTTKQSISTTSSSIPTSGSSTNTEKSTTQHPTNTTKVSTATTADTATTEHYISTTTYATDKSTSQQPTTILPVNCDVRFLNNTFTCVANGRYAVPGDTTCAKYYYCFKLSSGKFTQTLYTCNVGLFNETAQACDKTYNCPCSTNTTSSVTSTTKQSISTTSSSIPTCASSTNSEKSTTQQPTNTTKVSTATTSDTATTEHYISTTTYATDKSTTQQPTTILPVNCDVRFLNNTFTCVANGRYSVPGDTTCAKYYYCFKLSSGKFTQTLYTCNVGLFNETAQACDKTYNCPCSTNTTSSVTSTTKQSISTTSSSIPTSASSTNTEKSTTQQPTNTTKVSTATTADTATTEHYISTTTYATDKSTTQQPTTILPVNCDVRFLNNTFTCVANGRYAVPGDTTCAKYYYCFKLSSGKFTQTLYTCNVGLFNETAQACDKTYNCPCSTNTTSSVTSTTKQSISTTSSSIPTSASSTNTEKSTTQQPTNTTKVSTATTADTATTEHYMSTTTYATDKSTTQQPTTILPVNCDVRFLNNTFSCVANGRYAVPGDTTCAKYYYCFKLSNGKFTQTLYTCNVGLFNETAEACDKTYNCPCSKNITTVTSNTEQSISTTLSITPSSASSTNTPGVATTEITTTEQSNKPSSLSTTIATSATTKKSTTTKKRTTQHTRTTKAPTTVTTTTDSSCTPSHKTFKCLKAGIFADPSDTTCKWFYVCKRLLFAYKKVKRHCVVGRFNPRLKICDISYRCPCGCTTSNKKFSCAKKGNFKDPKDSSCTKYYTCTKQRHGKFRQSHLSCRLGKKFNPESQRCESLYTCPCSY